MVRRTRVFYYDLSTLQMEGMGVRLLTRVARAAGPAAGLLALLVLQLHDAPLAGAAPLPARALVFSDQARRLLLLEYQSYPTEFLGCMIGAVRGDAVIVQRIAPADVNPGESTRTSVVPRQTCEDAGWANTVGMIHSHPGGERCWYFFPGTQVTSSDGQSFLRQPYPVDAIMCGDEVVWIARNMVQKQVPLTDQSKRANVAREQQRGNRVHSGSASRTGVDE